jgi:hypothetical protein
MEMRKSSCPQHYQNHMAFRWSENFIDIFCLHCCVLYLLLTDSYHRDVICNWYGGQNASLELAALVPGYKDMFPSAGYADIVVNDSYVGGHVRQYGNLSFSRIFDAGHLVPFYQPETAFTVFSRIIQGDDISLGRNIDLSTFQTNGIRDSSIRRNEVPPEPASVCWIRDVASTCTDEQRKAIERGEGVVSYGIWSLNPVAAPEISVKRTSQSKVQVPRTTTTVPLTGVFTANAPPMTTKEVIVTTKPRSSASRRTLLGADKWSLIGLRAVGDMDRSAELAWKGVMVFVVLCNLNFV